MTLIDPVLRNTSGKRNVRFSASQSIERPTYRQVANLALAEAWMQNRVLQNQIREVNYQTRNPRPPCDSYNTHFLMATGTLRSQDPNWSFQLPQRRLNSPLPYALDLVVGCGGIPVPQDPHKYFPLQFSAGQIWSILKRWSWAVTGV